MKMTLGFMMEPMLGNRARGVKGKMKPDFTFTS
jgi:hypothetical protein